MAGLQTEYSFVLPKGFVDDVGLLHRHGVMRLATARDEIEPLRSTQIVGPDDPYLTVLVLARVVTELGTMVSVTVETIEGLFAADLAFLQDLYGIINFGDPADVAALQALVEDHEEAAAHDADADGLQPGAPSEVPGDRSSGNEPRRSARPRAHVEEVGRASAP